MNSLCIIKEGCCGLLACHQIHMCKPSVQFSHSVVSNSLRPHESQHARPPCPSPTPGVHWDSRPSSQWCHSAISSSVVPFSSCPQSLPASESFPMSQLFFFFFSFRYYILTFCYKSWEFSFYIFPVHLFDSYVSFHLKNNLFLPL